MKDSVWSRDPRTKTWSYLGTRIAKKVQRVDQVVRKSRPEESSDNKIELIRAWPFNSKNFEIDSIFIRATADIAPSWEYFKEESYGELA